VAGAGTNDTRTTIDRHEALARVDGVAASLAVVPYYVRPSEAGIVAHFQAVAERSPVPMIIYNVPYRTGRGLGADALLELAATPGVCGLKQAVGTLAAARQGG
jgi:4-hydroxy-tetrahydrodipicolinate synthase